jgi:hypothetical protein
MNKINQKLDSKSESLLRESLGKNVQTIMSGNLNLNLELKNIISTTVSIGIGDKEYLIISNEWADTPEEAIDYYFLKVKIDKTPADIKTINEPKLNNSIVHQPNFSSISLGASSEIAEISVFEKNKKGDNEMVNYDSAILFKRKDGQIFLIKNDDSITGYLKIVLDTMQIDFEISELKLRLAMK